MPDNVIRLDDFRAPKRRKPPASPSARDLLDIFRELFVLCERAGMFGDEQPGGAA